MKSYKQFCTESYSARENVQEAIPLVVGGALKLASMGLGAYSAYRAAQDLSKGNYKGAALNALGVLPAGGRAFNAVRAVGRGKNLARGASAATSTARWSSPARNQAINSTIDTGASTVKGTAKTLQKANQKTRIQPGY